MVGPVDTGPVPSASMTGDLSPCEASRSLTMATEEQIRNYAHLLWERAGRPEGRAAEFWHAAEVELNAESESPDAPTEEMQPT